MKKTTLVLLLVFMARIVFAQKNDPGYAGVYMTANDFINNHLSYRINTTAAGCKLGFSPIADWALTIRIVTPDSVNTFKPGTIFGYYDQGKVYRYAPEGEPYVSNDYYRIEDDHGLIIYTSEFNDGSEYFYSSNLTSTIHRLSLKNLEHDFKAYPSFISAIAHFNKKEVHGDLSKRDADGSFMVNNIYTRTIRK